MFLGIDQSLRSTGIAVLRSGTTRPEYLATIEPGKLRGAERLASIYGEIEDVLKNYGIRRAALEGYSMESVNRSFDLGELGGIVRLCLIRNNVNFIVVPPLSLKLFVTGKGQASKTQVQTATMKRWGQAINQDDECDAYGLAHVARVYETGDSAIRCELEVVSKLYHENNPVSLTALHIKRPST